MEFILAICENPIFVVSPGQSKKNNRGFDVTGCQKACATTDSLSVTIGGSSSSVRNPNEAG